MVMTKSLLVFAFVWSAHTVCSLRQGRAQDNLGGLSNSSAAFAKAPDSTLPHCRKTSVPLYVHYMVWFRKPGSGGHWDQINGDLYKSKSSQCPCVPKSSSDKTCATFNKAVSRTKHNQAPMFYPPIDGPYESSDAATIREHVAMMKQNCAAGVIVDFQLPENTNLRPIFIESTRLVAEEIAKQRMKWALMYDQSSKAGDYVTSQSETDSDWSFIWGSDFLGGMSQAAQNAYLRTPDDQRVFLAFGPSRFPGKNVRSQCEKCAFVSQDGLQSSSQKFDPQGYANNGVFSWISPKNYNCGRGIGYLAPGDNNCMSGCESWRSCNRQQDPTKFWPERFYMKTTCKGGLCIGAAFPGFRAVYSHHGAIERSTSLLRQTLQLCEDNKPWLCQVQTFNDLKEGTGIQPSFYCNKHGDAAASPNAFMDTMREFKR